MPLDKIRILISGRFGNLNMGDDAIFLGMVQAITGKIPNADFLVFADDPGFIEKQYGIRSFPHWPVGLKRRFTAVFRIGFWVYLLRLIKVLKSADLFILGGGGFLEGGFRRRSNFGVVPFWLSKMLLAQLLGKPTVMYALGVGIIHRRLDKFLMRVIGNRAKLITVRNAGSRNNLIDCSIVPSKIQVTADAAFGYRPSFEKRNVKCRFLEDFRVLSNLNGKPLIGFVLSPLWTNTNHNGDALCKDQIEFDGIIARSIDLLTEKLDARILVFLTHYREDKCLKSVVDDIYSRTEKKENVFIIDRTFTPQQYADFISHLNVIVSMKLHPLILSSLTKVPFAGIVTHYKIGEFMSQVGMQDYVIYCQDTCPKDIYERIQSLLSNASSITGMLENKVSRLREKADLNARSIKDLVGNVVSRASPLNIGCP